MSRTIPRDDVQIMGIETKNPTLCRCESPFLSRNAEYAADESQFSIDR